MSGSTVSWSTQPAERHVLAAEAYLTLLTGAAEAHRMAEALQAGQNVAHGAADLLRASGLPVLPHDDPHVARDLHEIHANTPLSPVLLVRGDLGRGVALTVADGYHRLCAAHHVEPTAIVECRIVDGPSAAA